MEKIIKVVGKANVKKSPDYTRINVRFVGEDKVYSKLVEKSASDLKTIKDLLARVGIETNTIKTKEFDIKPVYDSVKDKKDITHTEFRTYVYVQTITFKFKNNNKTLGDILYFLSSMDLKTKVDIYYELDDETNYRDVLLEEALKDAKRQADIICKNTGAIVEGVANVTYGVDEFEYDDMPRGVPHRGCLMNYDNCVSRSDYDVEILPEDIDLCSTVKVTYLLK